MDECVCVITFSADIMVRSAGFGGAQVEMGGGMEGKGMGVCVG